MPRKQGRTPTAELWQIIMQKAVEVLPDDTPETLQRRVMEQAEWEILPRTVAMICSGEIK